MEANNNSIGTIPMQDLRARMRRALSRVPGEKVVACLLEYHGDALFSREMAHDMIKRDILSYDDLGLEYADDYKPAST